MDSGHVYAVDDLMDRIIDEQETQLADEHRSAATVEVPERSFFTRPSGVRRSGFGG
ncbi:hypothetical protein [Actinosynnema sp. ALI-1.44]|uniref:hypothetical protein n=1 Tax=Actinosynnema sp. ALI-1.44 TaxID=1933779 RepID=UPI00143D8984|nr:hypothetical protein [Actinosynnema sp. ALI-1.44]